MKRPSATWRGDAGVGSPMRTLFLLAKDLDRRALAEHAQRRMPFPLPTDLMHRGAQGANVGHDQHRPTARLQHTVHVRDALLIEWHDFLRRAELLAKGRIAEDA